MITLETTLPSPEAAPCTAVSFLDHDALFVARRQQGLALYNKEGEVLDYPGETYRRQREEGGRRQEGRREKEGGRRKEERGRRGARVGE
jgi:hypothetical protein